MPTLAPDPVARYHWWFHQSPAVLVSAWTGRDGQPNLFADSVQLELDCRLRTEQLRTAHALRQAAGPSCARLTAQDISADLVAALMIHQAHLDPAADPRRLVRLETDLFLLRTMHIPDADKMHLFALFGKKCVPMRHALTRAGAWDEDLQQPNAETTAAMLHLTPGLDGVSKAVNEAERGMLPVEPTICLGQPTSFDPSRAPDGKAILWLQLPEAPRHIKGDAAGEIATPADGRWTDAVREAYADRIEAILCRHIPDFKSLVLARRCYSPADLETMNVNLVGGDPYGGACTIDQFFLWRPLRGTRNHDTPVKRLWQIGASTHPGPGLGGGSGFLLASMLK